MNVLKRVSRYHGLFWILFLSVFPAILGQEAINANRNLSPTITPSVYNLNQPVGSTLDLSCTGTRSLDWIIPSRILKNGRNIFNIETLELGPGNFKSTLTLRNTVASETGRYKCRYNDTPVAESELEDRVGVSFINVFINDPDKLFIGTDEFLSVHTLKENEPYVIACLPSYSSAEIFLINPNGKPVHKAADVKFDPTVGFTILFPNVFFTGEFTCRYEVEINGIIKKEEERLLLYYHEANNEAPRPIIDSAGAKHVVAGKSFVLTCNITSGGSLPVELNWEYPSPATASRARTQYSAEERTSDNGYRYSLIQSTLTVSDVDELLDNGQYTCVSTIPSNRRQSKTSVSIKTFSRGVESHLDLSPRRPEMRVLKGGHVVLIAEYHAYPEPVFQWRRNGREVPTGGRFTRDKRDNTTSLRIVDSHGEDAGIYTVEAMAGAGKAAVNITLFVDEPPKVELESNVSKPFFAVDGHTEFRCTVTAFPQADISWSFQPCQRTCLDGGMQTTGRWVNVTNEKVSSMVDLSGRKVISRYPVAIKEQGSGFLRCVARNYFSGREHQAFQIQRILATDVDGGFQTKMLPEQPIENQEVSMICTVNNYEYSSATWEWRSSPNQEYSQILPNTRDYRVTSENSLFSLVVTLKIRSAHVGLNGFYRCMAGHKNGPKPSREPIQLRLKRAQAPTFDPDVRDSEEVREIDYQDTLRLDCSASGAPSPTYKWTRDHVVIDQLPSIQFEKGGAILVYGKITQDDHGDYRCNASNSEGFLEKKWRVKVHGESAQERKRRWIIVGSSVGTITFILVPILIFVCLRLMKEKKRREELEYLEGMLNNETANPDLIDPGVPLTEQVQLLPYDEKWEVPRENLKLFNKLLGTGQFGRVVKGEVKNLMGAQGKTIVAVKMLKETADLVQRKALLGEIKIMAHIGQHVNVVNLMGALTKNMIKGELYMLTEYCKYGSLRDYLQKHQANRFFNQVDVITGKLLPLSDEEEDALSKKRLDLIGSEKDWDGRIITTRDLICYSFQISNGMNYLNQKNVIHRDLAARNVLMAEDNVVKICDFGLAKQQYTYLKTNQAELPIKWMAIESIYDQIFSKESDVWAFGILLWELFTLGATPYPGLNVDSDFVERIRDGYRMERPYLAPKDIYEIMRHCWESSPKSRPDFAALIAQLGNLLENSTRKKYLDMNAPYQLYNEEHGSGYVNDPIKRSSQIDGSSQYLNTYQLTPAVAVAPRPSTPIKPKRSLRPTGTGQNALDSMELQPMLHWNEASSALNPSRPGNMIENEDYLNDNFIRVPVNMSLQRNGLPLPKEEGFHTDGSTGASGDSRTNYLYASGLKKAPIVPFSSDV